MRSLVRRRPKSSGHVLLAVARTREDAQAEGLEREGGGLREAGRRPEQLAAVRAGLRRVPLGHEAVGHVEVLVARRVPAECGGSQASQHHSLHTLLLLRVSQRGTARTGTDRVRQRSGRQR